MNSSYAELHCHSNYSFQEGASSVEELLFRAKELDYRALALTDHDNLCGAMHFAQVAKTLEMQTITGAEITLNDGSHLTLLAETQQGYSNLSNIISYAYISGDRKNPAFDIKHLSEMAQGLVLLTGCRQGRLPSLVAEGRHREAEDQLRQYLDWFGTSNVFVELQHNLVQGDTPRIRRLVDLANRYGVSTVATNNVHYHIPDRHRLQDALVAISNNQSLEETHRQRRPNRHFHLKSPEEMSNLFLEYPTAVKNTLRIADRCGFDITRDMGYRFPDYPVPEGFTPQSFLEDLCRQAAERRYGGINDRVQSRLDEELRLINRHNLSGFFLIYYEIIQMAREIMIEMGLSEVEIPLEERPPGRGRGSSVSMLVGYLIGLSHIDPLKYNLTLERFLSDDMGSVPDIDLDFPRNIREELIKRVHEKWGWDHAVLTGMISTYKMKGAIRDLGKALGLPSQDVDKLAKRVDSHSARELELEMESLPEFRDKTDSPVWRDLIELSAQLDGFPKYLAQHPGGMIISSSPLTDIVPVQQSAIDNRYICHWDKDSIDQAGFVKIDFLALGALSQMQECLQLIEERDGHYIDLSRIDFDDQAVYGMMHQADTIGIFQVESAAQMQTVPRIRPINLTDMAYEVGAVRPGVGVNDGVTQFIQRRTQSIPWDYDHPLEQRALERTLGIILFQDQVNHVARDVAGFTPLEADQLRRAFGRRNNQSLIAFYWEKFRQGAGDLGVPRDVAEKIFKKFNGQYMFPESHAFAFGATAYHMAWLKYYYPLEFFTAIFNQQPMGFYNTETLKEDARRHGITVLNPDINLSMEKCTIVSGGRSRPPFNPPFVRGERRGTPMGEGRGPLMGGTRETSRDERSTSNSPAFVKGGWGDFRPSATPLSETEGAGGEGGDSLLLGFLYVKGVGGAATTSIVQSRESGGPFSDLGNAMERTGLQREALENLVSAGAFDSLTPDRRSTLWEVGLRYRPHGYQQALPLPVEQDMAELPKQTEWEIMMDEYRTMQLHPKGHLMTMLRPHLGQEVLNSREVVNRPDGEVVTVVGIVIRRQRPLSKAVFLTLEDEFGHIPIAVWPQAFKKHRMDIKEPVLIIRGIISRREGTMNIVAQHIQGTQGLPHMPKARSWQ